MSNFNNVPPGIKDMIVHVAEFYCHDNEYIEGPRLLAQTITYNPVENRTEQTTYYADGSVHSRFVTTGQADDRRSIIYRYRMDGRLRDQWLITYKPDGSRARAYTYDEQGKLHQYPVQKEETTTFFAPEQIEESGESLRREFDVRGNWIRETRFQKKSDRGKLVEVPIMVTYRTITYL